MATHKEFIELIKQIPLGTVVTYKMIATWAGSPAAAISVGDALKQRLNDPDLPWHRVIDADGVLSSNAPPEQRELLEQEGIVPGENGCIDLDHFAWMGPRADCLEKKIEAADELLDLDEAGLLRLYARVMEEIRRRKISRGMNNPIGDLAERLAGKALGAELMSQSNAGFDLQGADGLRYEVKGRRINSQPGSRQLGGIRNLNEQKFDFLVGILFNEDLSVHRAALIPWSTVMEKASYSDHTKAWRFILHDQVWEIPGVIDLPLN
ncbi:MAG TPA: hypothetical protein DD435_10365 [Cyanobacteria bacterium UBA8530]|nr:hypothetical protein [Cyanobacteria bacterium UBA8530]